MQSNLLLIAPPDEILGRVLYPMEILVVLLLILANGVLAMSEIAVVSARQARLQERADRGDAGARTAIDLQNNSTRFLSTIQIGISGVGVLAGAFGGTTIAEHLAPLFAGVPWLAPYSDALAVGLVVILITYLSLVLGELVPKQIALNDPEGVSSAVARPMKFLSKIGAPFVYFLSISTEVVVRLLHLKRPQESPVTDQEIEILLDEGTSAGVFDPAEQDMIKHVLRLGDQRVRDLVTPRHEIIALDVRDSPEEIKARLQEQRHSRFPLIDANLDNVLGMVKAETLLEQILAGETINLRAGLETPLFVPENMPALTALEHFKQNHTHVAIVIDEYGGTQGLVTLADILEAIVGNIAVTEEPPSQDLVQREDGSWLIDGGFAIKEFMERFEVCDWQEDDSYRTLAGFIMASLGRVPAVGEHLEKFGLRIEVVDMDGARIDRVLVNRTPAPAKAA